jgi:2-haloacid dehalogenase
VTGPHPTVVFDLGNVLLDWNPRRGFIDLIDDRAELDHFLTEICNFEWHYQQDAGRPIEEATAELQAQHPEYADLIGRYYERWPQMTPGALPATVDVLRELRDAGVRLVALTNWPAGLFDPARERFPFFEWFEGIVVSGDEKVAKPDPAIFRLLLERFALDPAATVYIDDTARHVAAASELGMTGLVFTNAVALRRDLASLGLPVAADVDVRSAVDTDYAELISIYNHYVVTSAATFDLDPIPTDDARGFFDPYGDSGPHRLLVATRDDRVVGYATSGQLRTRPAYDSSTEVTVYLHHEEGGRGIGSMLYQQLFSDLRDEDLHRAYAVIAQPNPSSVALHRRFGFSEVGTMHEVGRKFDRWWDVLWMERPMP